MRSCRLSKLYIVIACVAAAAAFGCGGDDDDGGGGGGVDASVSIDAPAQLDAPNAELTGLGQSCDPAMQGADCPAEANGCLTFGQGATAGICTKLCLQTGSFTTDAQSQPGPFDPDPATMNSVCTRSLTHVASSAGSVSLDHSRTRPK